MANGISGDEREAEKWRKQFKEMINAVLDQVISANSLLTGAVFLGLTFATPNEQGLESRLECAVGTNAAKKLVVYEVFSFACFIFSSLMAGSVKVVIHSFGLNRQEPQSRLPWRQPLRRRKGVMFLLSIMSSVAGVGLLVASIVSIVEIKLGKLNCGSPYALTAGISIIVLVVVAGALYLGSMLGANLFIVLGDSLWLGEFLDEDRNNFK